LLRASQNGYADVVPVLLATSANVNAVANRSYNYTSLLLASLKGHVEVFKLLLGAGANVNAAL
jgi:ankyrin repeat protein